MIRSRALERPWASRRNLLALPGVGRLLRWRHARPLLQGIMLLVTALILFDGFTGPQRAGENLSTVGIWFHYRAFLLLALLVAGNLFCMACPFMLPRGLARRLQTRLGIGRGWPAWLPQKGVAIVLLVLFFWSYEAFDLWASPWLTAWLIAGYFVAAFVTDLLFRGASFCKHVCPVGQFSTVYSTIAPTEIAILEPDTCTTCATRDCIAGREGIPGCETHLFQPKKVGNLDCTYCLDCIHACPYDNVGLLVRTPVVELASDTRRSGIGYLSRRFDVALLILILTAGAFMQAFGMIAPVGRLQAWLEVTFGIASEPVRLAIIFLFGVVLLPLVLVTLAAHAGRALGGGRSPLREEIARFAPALVPVGAGMWAAHYLFHYLITAWVPIPIFQSLVDRLAGLPLVGAPDWGRAGLLGLNQILVLQSILLYAGLLGSLVIGWQIARDRYGHARATRGWAPWAMLFVLLLAWGLWIMATPMEMRGMPGMTMEMPMETPGGMPMEMPMDGPMP